MIHDGFLVRDLRLTTGFEKVIAVRQKRYVISKSEGFLEKNPVPAKILANFGHAAKSRIMIDRIERARAG